MSSIAKSKSKNARKRASKAKKATQNPLMNAPLSRASRRPTVYLRSAVPTLKGASARFVGCDYIGAVSTPASGPGVTPYNISASNSTTFPRLSAIAAIFEEFKFRKCNFVACGKSAATQAGDYTQCVNYQTSGGTSLTSLSQLRNEEGQVTSKFWEDQTVRLDEGRAVRPWFVTTQISTDDGDGYQGVYYLGLDAVGSAIPVVDLFVEYDCEFAQGQASGAPELTPALRELCSLPDGRELIEQIARLVTGWKPPETVVVSVDDRASRAMSALSDFCVPKGPSPLDQRRLTSDPSAASRSSKF